MNKEILVAFVSKKLKHDFEILEKGKVQDKVLYKFINRAINDLKLDPICGIKIPKKLWPKNI